MKTYQSFGKVYHTRSILRKNFDSHYKNILTLMYALSSWRLAIIEIARFKKCNIYNICYHHYFY